MSTPEDNTTAASPPEDGETSETAASTEPSRTEPSAAAPGDEPAADASGEEPTATAPNTGPLGQERGVGFAIVMWLVTLGIYGLYWLYKSFAEVKHHRGEGVGGMVGVLLSLIIVGYFKLPQYIGRMYRAEGNDNPPVSGVSGLWVFVPYVGTLIWIAKVQGALNSYWKAKGAGSVASVPASTSSF